MNQNTIQRMPAAEMTVAELLKQWPSCTSVFIERRMACVGCELSGFESIADAARFYNLDESQFLAALRAAAGSAAGNR